MKVLLVDGDNLANRNYFALSLSTTDGFATGLIFGVISSMLSQQLTSQYDKVIVVWDPPGGSLFRKELFPLYKANRSQKDGTYLEQKEACQDLLDAMGVIQVIKPGVECDDIIGYLALETFSEDDVFILSNDEDMLQLLSTRVHIISPVKGIITPDAEGKVTIEKQGKSIRLTPEQVVSYKAMVGDPSDNYPGIPQFGITAAISYFAHNKSVDDVINCTADLRDIPYRAVSAIQMTLPILPKFKQLAQINITEGAVELPDRPVANKPKVKALFNEFEFKEFDGLGDRVYCIGGK